MGDSRCGLTLNSIPSLAQLFPALKVLLCYGAAGSAPFALSKILKIIRDNRNLPVELLECAQTFRLRWLLGPIERRQKLLEAKRKLLRLEARCQADGLDEILPIAMTPRHYRQGEIAPTHSPAELPQHPHTVRRV